MPKTKTNITSSMDVDKYIAALPEEASEVLTKLRNIIKAAVPAAEEVISYGVPAFRQNRMIVAYGTAKNHFSFFVMSPAVMTAFKDQLKSFNTSKGTVHFTAEYPLPASLIKNIVKARLAENELLANLKKK